MRHILFVFMNVVLFYSDHIYNCSYNSYIYYLDVRLIAPGTEPEETPRRSTYLCFYLNQGHSYAASSLIRPSSSHSIGPKGLPDEIPAPIRSSLGRHLPVSESQLRQCSVTGSVWPLRQCVHLRRPLPRLDGARLSCVHCDILRPPNGVVDCSAVVLRRPRILPFASDGSVDLNRCQSGSRRRSLRLASDWLVAHRESGSDDACPCPCASCLFCSSCVWTDARPSARLREACRAAGLWESDHRSIPNH